MTWIITLKHKYMIIERLVRLELEERKIIKNEPGFIIWKLPSFSKSSDIFKYSENQYYSDKLKWPNTY